jgi:formamidopyrimidine-DNA glycosylase
MPELPEVEVVRRGLSHWAVGRTITAVDVLDPRSVRRHSLGIEDFRGNLLGARILDVVRRGKFLWMPLADDDGVSGLADDDGVSGLADDGVPGLPADGLPQPHTALMAHLGMSGQLLMQDPSQPHEKHLKVLLTLSPQEGAPDQLRFVDQRIFGGLFVTSLVPTADGLPGGQSGSQGDFKNDACNASGDGNASLASTRENEPNGGIHLAGLPLIAAEAAHIARDPLDPDFSMDAFYRKLRARKTGLKRALLDQSLVSGIGNIYADEALWAAKLHFARPTDTLRRSEAERVVRASQEVMRRALDAGGTSFDSLYVNVNGASGYFERSLNAYGREGQPCLRCAELGLETRIRRDTFMNRSSYTCPVCQPRPRRGRW